MARAIAVVATRRVVIVVVASRATYAARIYGRILNNQSLDRARVVRRLTQVGVGGNVALVVAKLLAGIVSGKWIVGCFILTFVDWWMAIVSKIQGKGYVWKSKRWFTGRKRIYYCHDCGHNFNG